MYCPKCGSENSTDQKYCRGCGQSLTSVRLALEGGVDEAVEVLRHEQGHTRHRVRLVICFLLILIAIATIFTAGKFGISNVQSGAAILIITLVLFIQLALKVRRAARALDLEKPKNLFFNSDAPKGPLLEASTRSLEFFRRTTAEAFTVTLMRCSV